MIKAGVFFTKPRGRIDEEELAKSLEEIGLIAEGYAKIKCPVDTGRLRNSISHITSSNMVAIGTNVEYGPYVELGTRRMKAQPFLRPAIEDHMQEYKDIIKKAIKD